MSREKINLKMEKPLTAKHKQKVDKTVELRNLLRRLAGLPIEISMSIMVQLDYDQLTALCEEISRDVRREIYTFALLQPICKDVNFWRDWLIYHGYDLPETLPKLFDIVRRKNETDLNILKSLFFEKPVDLRTNKLMYLKNRAAENPAALQLLLDWDYLIQQISFREERENGLPHEFAIQVYEDDEYDVDWPERLTFEDLLDILVENNFTKGASGLLEDSTAIFKNSLVGSKNRSSVLEDAFMEQRLAIMENFAQEGDLVTIWDGPTRTQYYFVVETDNGKELVEIERYESGTKTYRVTFVFPEEAYPFLKKNNVRSYYDINEFYPIFGKDVRIFYKKNGERYPFLGSRARD